ncbi:DUF2524 family protein [Texcoconibacillus texcoconensis]|uniref:Flagellar basal body-associated protein FliL n=1 Tax=Texcoconibacillus texcoconensis TaxID=1095777 RepID=A0A840QQI0_9BACI|nr:DUF2524 family protein [Texcoconibacillus texcoconensis]MBB5173598.1 flagellar basal body-associated protein FliL [Texcoconibacillus texcoconensis]
MTNDQQVEQRLDSIEQVLEQAHTQLDQANQLQSNDNIEYYEMQIELEQANEELEKMITSTRPEMRDPLVRMQQQVQQMQNRMILGS